MVSSASYPNWLRLSIQQAMKRWTMMLLVVVLSFGGFNAWIMAQQNDDLDPAAKELSAGLGMGVNFGNMLEAPSEGAWGSTAKTSYFALVKQAGFDHIRLPISWTYHADATAPYTIDPVFFARVDELVSQALAANLKIIVNNHHYEELNQDPVAERERALGIWLQIAQRYQNQPNTVYFEILNEPHDQFNQNPLLWDMFLQEAVDLIRLSNPTRKIIAGPVNYNSISALGSFNPPADPHLIASVHYYSPFLFTHQGAEWVTPSPPIGVTWNPAEIVINDQWDNWSWQTTSTLNQDGVRLQYNQGWAGFALHNEAGIARPDRLVFTVDQALNLRIVLKDSNGVEHEYRISTTAGKKQYTIDFTNLPGNLIIKDLFFQNNSPNPSVAFLLSEYRFESGNQALPLIVTKAEAIQMSLQVASDWAKARNLPMYLGEFGAYSTADLNSRVLWTRSVRVAARNTRMDACYWELASGFGILDPQTDQWRERLLRALIPGKQRLPRDRTR